jgi:hypothetical protein
MPPAPTDGNRNADVLDEVADYLASGLGLTMGVNMFNGELPEPNEDGVAPSDGVYLIELAGALGQPEDMYLDTETHLFDLWASSSSTITAKTLLHQAYDILERKANYPLVNWYIYFSYANSTIRDEGRGREGNRLFSLGFTIKCRNLNNIS